MKIPPPSFFLKEHMRGMTPNKLAKALKVSPPRVYGILNGSRRVTPDMALRFARLFGGSAEQWLKWQTAYDLSLVPEETLRKISEIKPYEPDE